MQTPFSCYYTTNGPGSASQAGGQVVPTVVTGTVNRLDPSGAIDATYPNVPIANISTGPVPLLTTNAGEIRVPVRPNGGAKGGFIVADGGNQPMQYLPGYGPLL